MVYFAGRCGADSALEPAGDQEDVKYCFPDFAELRPDIRLEFIIRRAKSDGDDASLDDDPRRDSLVSNCVPGTVSDAALIIYEALSIRPRSWTFGFRRRPR